MYYRKAIVFGLFVSVLLIGCKQQENIPAKCTNSPSVLRPPETIEELLGLSNVFLLGRFSDFRLVDANMLSSEFGWSNVYEGCTLKYQRARLLDKSAEVFSSEIVKGTYSEVINLDDRCNDYIYTEWICDGGPPPRDGSMEDYCWQKEEPRNTCALSPWHYTLPEKSDEVWAMFLSRDPSNAKESNVPTLRMLFRVENDSIDLSVLERGEKVTLSELGTFLLKNVPADGFHFL